MPVDHYVVFQFGDALGTRSWVIGGSVSRGEQLQTVGLLKIFLPYTFVIFYIQSTCL